MPTIEVLLQSFQKIKVRVSKSELEEALEELAGLLPQTGLEMEDEVLALQQQYFFAQKQINLNLIENSEYSRTLSNISFAALRLITTICKQLQQQQTSGAVPSAGISVTEAETEATPTAAQNLPPLLQEGLQKMDDSDYSTALQCFSAYLQINPRSWHAMHYLGSLHETLGLWDEAVHWYSEALKVNPADAIAANNRGNIRMEQLAQYDKAFKDFSTALIADPALITARYNRALASMYLSQYDSAIADLTACIQQHFMEDTAYGLRGICLNAMERHDEAREDLKIALRAEPENATYWSSYGLCEYHNGRYQDAIGLLSHALSLNPQQPEMLNVRGMSYFFLEDYVTAQADFEEVIRQKPDYAYAWYFLGLCRKIRGNAAEAIRYLTEALRLNPQLAEAYAILGVIAYENNQIDEAIRLCEQALSIKDDVAVAHEYLKKAREARSSGGLWNKLFGG